MTRILHNPTYPQMVAFMQQLQDLHRTADLLADAYTHTRDDLAARFPDPLAVQDQTGRYVLLDALTALATIQAVTFTNSIPEGPS